MNTLSISEVVMCLIIAAVMMEKNKQYDRWNYTNSWWLVSRHSETMTESQGSHVVGFLFCDDLCKTANTCSAI